MKGGLSRDTTNAHTAILLPVRNICLFSDGLDENIGL